MNSDIQTVTFAKEAVLLSLSATATAIETPQELWPSDILHGSCSFEEISSIFGHSPYFSNNVQYNTIHYSKSGFVSNLSLMFIRALNYAAGIKYSGLITSSVCSATSLHGDTNFKLNERVLLTKVHLSIIETGSIYYCRGLDKIIILYDMYIYNSTLAYIDHDQIQSCI